MISCGNVREACRNSRIRNGVAIRGRMTANVEFTSPSCAKRRNNGIIVAANGIMIARSRMAMTASLAREW